MADGEETPKQAIARKLDMWNIWLKKEGISRKERLYELKRMKKDLKNIDKIMSTIEETKDE